MSQREKGRYTIGDSFTRGGKTRKIVKIIVPVRADAYSVPCEPVSGKNTYHIVWSSPTTNSRETYCKRWHDWVTGKVKP